MLLYIAITILSIPSSSELSSTIAMSVGIFIGMIFFPIILSTGSAAILFILLRKKYNLSFFDYFSLSFFSFTLLIVFGML